MKCPECREQMKQIPIGEDIINECPRCRGLWFDQGELEAVKDEVLPEMSWLDIDTWKEKADFKASMDILYCPKCQDIALTVIEDQSSLTKISLCTQCKGAWLATGQFLNFLNALLEEANQKTVPEYIKISLQQAKEMITNPDAIISEWQDLKTVLKLLKHRIFH
jgi:Zn-finger nucleic acid-binding protein